MKKIKRLMFLFLMILCIGLPCESYQNYLDQFNDFAKTTFYCQEGIEYDTMMHDISEKAEEHEVMIFKIRTQVHTLFFSEIDVYADAVATSYLQEEYDIFAGTFNSLVSGKTQINYHAFSEIPESLVTIEPEFQLVGNMERMTAFKSELIDLYGGSFPKHDGYDGRKDSRTVLCVVWILAIILTCFFTLYETFMLKKENFVRITMGETLLSIWTKYVLCDLMYMIVAFLIVTMLAHLIYGTIFLKEYAYMMFAITLLMNMLVSMNMLNLKKSSMVFDIGISLKMLQINHVFRCVIIILTSACMSMALSTIYESSRFYRQKSFYERYADHVVLQNLKAEDGGETFSIEGQFYKNYAQELEIVYLCERMTLSSGKTALIANHNAIDYLQTAIPILQDQSFDKDIYIIHQASQPLSSKDMANLKPIVDCEVVEYTYHEDIELVAVGLNSDKQLTVWAKNPVIVYYHTDFADLYDTSLLPMEVPIVYSFVKNNPTIEAFMKSNHIQYSCTNVIEVFEQQWIKLKRTSYLNFILLMFLLVLDVLLIFSIVKLEYAVNAVELSIKRIMGYSMTERFRKQYVASLAVYAISLLIALAISFFLQIGSPIFIACGILWLYITETVIFTIVANMYGRKNLQKILKGDVL